MVLRKERSEGFDDEGVNFAEGVKVEMALREEEEEEEEALSERQGRRIGGRRR